MKLKSALALVILIGSIFLAQAHAQAVLKPLNPSEVCMVNDTFMGKPQIPVKVGEKTYYGCCEGCAGRIKDDPSIRYSRDPVTGNRVDKAAAFIVEAAGGTALYFESADTAKKYTENRR